MPRSAAPSSNATRCWLEQRVRVAGLRATVLARDEIVDHARLQRAGAEQRDQRDDVLEGVGLQLLDQVAHAARFELEDRGGLAALEQRVGRRIVGRQRGDVDGCLAEFRAARVDRLDRPVDDRQRAQAEEVELDQPDRFDVVLVELRDQAFAAGFREHRRVVRQRAGCDDDAAGMAAGVARQVLELEREIDQLLDVLIGRIQRLELGDYAIGFLARFVRAAERILERQVERNLRQQLGDAVDLAVRHAQHAAGVAQHRLRRHRAVGDDLADAVAAVLAGDVVDDLVAAVHAEIDVEVGQRHALGIEEAFKQQVVAQRIEIGDAERVGDQRSRARAAARTDRDIVLLGPVDEVGDDQEVARKTHLHDDVELGFEPAFVIRAGEAVRRFVFCQPRDQAFARLRADEAVERVLRGHRKRRQEVLAETELEIAALGELDRVLDQLRQIGEQRRHFFRRLQVLIRRILVRPLRVGEHAAGVDAHARLVRFEILAREEAHVVAGDDRQIEHARKPDCLRQERVLASAVRARGLEVEPVRKAPAPSFRAGVRRIVAAAEQQAADVAVAAGQCDQSRVRMVEPVDVDQRVLAVAAFGVSTRQQAREIEITLAVLAQHGQALQLAAILGIADPQIATGDRLDAGGLGGLVELDQREQVALVGQRDGRHSGVHAGVDQIVDAYRRIGQRVLAVDVQVGEQRGHDGVARGQSAA